MDSIKSHNILHNRQAVRHGIHAISPNRLRNNIFRRVKQMMHLYLKLFKRYLRNIKIKKHVKALYCS